MRRHQPGLQVSLSFIMRLCAMVNSVFRLTATISAYLRTKQVLDEQPSQSAKKVIQNVIQNSYGHKKSTPEMP